MKSLFLAGAAAATMALTISGHNGADLRPDATTRADGHADAPAAAHGPAAGLDIYQVRARRSGAWLLMAVTVADLTRANATPASDPVTGLRRLPFTARVDVYRGDTLVWRVRNTTPGHASVTTASGTPVDCRPGRPDNGAVATVNRDLDLVTYKVPADCLHDPRQLRVAATVSAPTAHGTYHDHTAKSDPFTLATPEPVRSTGACPQRHQPHGSCRH